MLVPLCECQMQYLWYLTLYLIEKPFTNRKDPDQAALVRAALSGSALFSYGNIIRYDPTLLLVDLTSTFFVQCTNVKVYLYSVDSG